MSVYEKPAPPIVPPTMPPPTPFRYATEDLYVDPINDPTPWVKKGGKLAVLRMFMRDTGVDIECVYTSVFCQVPLVYTSATPIEA